MGMWNLLIRHNWMYDFLIQYLGQPNVISQPHEFYLCIYPVHTQGWYLSCPDTGWILRVSWMPTPQTVTYQMKLPYRLLYLWVSGFVAHGLFPWLGSFSFTSAHLADGARERVAPLHVASPPFCGRQMEGTYMSASKSKHLFWETASGIKPNHTFLWGSPIDYNGTCFWGTWFSSVGSSGFLT